MYSTINYIQDNMSSIMYSTINYIQDNMSLIMYSTINYIQGKDLVFIKEKGILIFRYLFKI